MGTDLHGLGQVTSPWIRKTLCWACGKNLSICSRSQKQERCGLLPGPLHMRTPPGPGGAGTQMGYSVGGTLHLQCVPDPRQPARWSLSPQNPGCPGAEEAIITAPQPGRSSGGKDSSPGRDKKTTGPMWLPPRGHGRVADAGLWGSLQARDIGRTEEMFPQGWCKGVPARWVGTEEAHASPARPPEPPCPGGGIHLPLLPHRRQPRR